MSRIGAKDVLIVDDDASIRNMLDTAFKRAGLACDTAADGVYAIEHLSETRYAVLLLDQMMPRLDGVGVLRQLRNIQMTDLERPVVVMVTASDDLGPLRAVGEMVPMVVRKPFDLRELSTLVEDCVTLRRVVP
jgi:DNA-binding response OmpR family regulator